MQNKTFIEADCLSEQEFRSNSVEILGVLVNPYSLPFLFCSKRFYALSMGTVPFHPW